MNVTLRNGYKQVCVWPGTVMGDSNPTDFEQFFMEQHGTRVQFLEEIVTEPDYENGLPVALTGGRHDVVFAVHDDDIAKFAIPRLTMGIRWIDDVYGNGGGDIYPERVQTYCCWDHTLDN